MFGDFTAEQCAAGHHAAVGDAGHQFAHPLGNRSADGDVVLQEQRLRAAYHEIVDETGDEIEADGVVLVHRLRDDKLGADAVGRCGKHRLAVPVAQRVTPANPPRPPRTSGLVALLASGLKSSTARSPASMSTPADA